MGDTRAGTRQVFRRTRWTAAASVVLVGAAALLAPGGAAQESEPEMGEIRNGTAKAVAIVNKIAPGVGDLELGITNGTAVTQVTNFLAQATSQTMDLGLIGSSLTSEGCDGDAYVSPEDLPQPTFVDNRDGDASASRDESGTDGAPGGAGRMAVEARKEVPEARARTTATGVGIPGVMELGGGVARSTSRVLPGEGREAIAIVTSSIDIAGVLELSGMRWFAHHRTGVEPMSDATFEVGRAELGGVPFPTDDLDALESAINDLLAPSGISLGFPHVQRFLEPTDLVRVTPMRVEMRDSPIGQTVLGPALDLTREQRIQLFDQLVEVNCDFASILLVGDIGTSVVAGTGFLTMDIGGAEASSSDLELGNPFGDAPPLSGALDLGSPALGPSGPAPAAGTPAVPGSPALPPAPAGGQEQAVPARSTGPIEELCESVHPNRDACSDGAAAAVALVGVLATVGMAGADLLRQRRRTAAVPA